MICKFCEYECPDAEALPCESGTDYDDDGNAIGSLLCGFLECPACTFCQGRVDVTPESIRCAKQIREIREGGSK
jgi:hypothetical protein